MLTSWRQWCRLCANEHSTVDIFFKNENDCDLAELIRRFFQLSVNPLDEAPVTICTSCYQFLISLARFSERVIKVGTMYASIVYNDIHSTDYSGLKYQFGLVKDEPIAYINKSDQATDTFDLTTEFMPSSIQFRNEPRQKNEIFDDDQNISDNAEEDVENKIDPLVLDLLTIEQTVQEEYETDDDNFDDDLEEKLDKCDSEDEKLISLIVKARKKSSGDEEKSSRKRTPRRSPRNGPPFECNRCEKAFLQQNALRSHKRAEHYKHQKKKYPCDHCDKKLSSLKAAQQHAIIHLEPDQKPVVPCPHCDKHFSVTTNLQKHIKTVHFGERPFVCETCGKSFTTMRNLREHRLTHDDATPFPCSQCDKQFKSLHSLKKHADIHNGTTYVCPNCGLILNTKRTLQMHMVVHSEQKNHKCTICDSEFKRAKALKNHLILHSGLRPYTCPFCDKTFANGSNCRSHKKKAHPIELAAMEAAGEVCRATNIPKLEQLKAS